MYTCRERERERESERERERERARERKRDTPTIIIERRRAGRAVAGARGEAHRIQRVRSLCSIIIIIIKQQ